MTFYRISTLAKPKDLEFEDYAPLVTPSRKFGFHFCGRPLRHKWRPLELEISMPLLPRPDFFDFGTGVFVCNQHARDLAGEALEMAGELLPASVKGEHGEFFVFNVTNCIEAIDEKRSTWSKPFPSVRILLKPIFHPEKLGEPTLFKIREDGGVNIYCVERTGDPDDGEFKAVVEHYGLTGLSFEPL